MRIYSGILSFVYSYLIISRFSTNSFRQELHVDRKQREFHFIPSCMHIQLYFIVKSTIIFQCPTYKSNTDFIEIEHIYVLRHLAITCSWWIALLAYKQFEEETVLKKHTPIMCFLFDITFLCEHELKRNVFLFSNILINLYLNW